MAAKGHVILFKIFSMDIEPSANCQYDYLKVSRAYFKYIIQKSKCPCIINKDGGWMIVIFTSLSTFLVI